MKLKNYNNFPLYTWTYSAFDGNTVFFYFLDKENNRLILIEYWADEESVAPAWQPFSVNGDYLTEETFDLSVDQKKYFTEKCKQVIEKANAKERAL